MKNRVLTIRLQRAKCEMRCISSDQYRQLLRRSVPIAENYLFDLILCQRLKKEAPDSSHARIYASLKVLFGETTSDYDYYKCSFGYMFSLKLNGEEKLNGEDRESEYTLYFTDVKGGMNFFFRKVYATQEECGNEIERDVLREPFEDDFSTKEMECFMAWFVFYLLGFMESYETCYDESFARSQNSCFAIYGYRDHHFFVDSYDDEERFSSAKKKVLKSEIPFDVVKTENLED